MSAPSPVFTRARVNPSPLAFPPFYLCLQAATGEGQRRGAAAGMGMEWCGEGRVREKGIRFAGRRLPQVCVSPTPKPRPSLSLSAQGSPQLAGQGAQHGWDAERSRGGEGYKNTRGPGARSLSRVRGVLSEEQPQLLSRTAPKQKRNKGRGPRTPTPCLPAAPPPAAGAPPTRPRPHQQPSVAAAAAAGGGRPRPRRSPGLGMRHSLSTAAPRPSRHPPPAAHGARRL